VEPEPGIRIVTDGLEGIAIEPPPV
jgi:hypothetical protein